MKTVVHKSDTRGSANHGWLKSRHTFSFAGYYNPERMGMLKVQDPTFEKTTIQFFPSDIEKAGIKNIKIGSKIRFRPRLEGQLTIACDLILVDAASEEVA